MYEGLLLTILKPILVDKSKLENAWRCIISAFYDRMLLAFLKRILVDKILEENAGRCIISVNVFGDASRNPQNSEEKI